MKKEIFIFALGTSPQIITETIYALAREGIQPDELYVVTTTAGEEKMKELLFKKKVLETLSRDYNLNIPFTEDSVVIPKRGKDLLEDIRTNKDNELFGDVITKLIQKKAADPNARLHCSLAGGRKTMSFYIGSALGLFGRPWDRLYHVLVSPAEVEGHPEFFYPPPKPISLELRDGSSISTKDIKVELAELPFVRLGDKIGRHLRGKSFRKLVAEGQRNLDLATTPPKLIIDLDERVLRIGEYTVDFTPTELAFYRMLAWRKEEMCKYPQKPYCQDCTACFPTVRELLDQEPWEKVHEFLKEISHSKALDMEGRHKDENGNWQFKDSYVRQKISRINGFIREELPVTLTHRYEIVSKGDYGDTRYGLIIDKNLIVVKSKRPREAH